MKVEFIKKSAPAATVSTPAPAATVAVAGAVPDRLFFDAEHTNGPGVVWVYNNKTGVSYWEKNGRWDSESGFSLDAAYRYCREGKWREILRPLSTIPGARFFKATDNPADRIAYLPGYRGRRNSFGNDTWWLTRSGELAHACSDGIKTLTTTDRFYTEVTGPLSDTPVSAPTPADLPVALTVDQLCSRWSMVAGKTFLICRRSSTTGRFEKVNKAGNPTEPIYFALFIPQTANPGEPMCGTVLVRTMRSPADVVQTRAIVDLQVEALPGYDNTLYFVEQQFEPRIEMRMTGPVIANTGSFKERLPAPTPPVQRYSTVTGDRIGSLISGTVLELTSRGAEVPPYGTLGTAAGAVRLITVGKGAKQTVLYSCGDALEKADSFWLADCSTYIVRSDLTAAISTT